MTLRLSSACSNQLSYAPMRRVAPETGGADEDRTRDLLLAKQALSQLSYTPVPEDRDSGSVIRTASPGSFDDTQTADAIPA